MVFAIPTVDFLLPLSHLQGSRNQFITKLERPLRNRFSISCCVRKKCKLLFVNDQLVFLNK